MVKLLCYMHLLQHSFQSAQTVNQTWMHAFGYNNILWKIFWLGGSRSMQPLSTGTVWEPVAAQFVSLLFNHVFKCGIQPAFNRNLIITPIIIAYSGSCNIHVANNYANTILTTYSKLRTHKFMCLYTKINFSAV